MTNDTAKRPVGRPRKALAMAGKVETFPVDRDTWSADMWDALLESEGLGLATGVTPNATHLRDGEHVECNECIGYHTNEVGCALYTEGN